MANLSFLRRFTLLPVEPVTIHQGYSFQIARFEDLIAAMPLQAQPSDNSFTEQSTGCRIGCSGREWGFEQ